MKLVQDYQDGLIELPWYDATPLITNGQGLIWGQDGSGTGSYNALVDCANKTADIFAVAAEAKSSSNTATNYQTPVVDQLKCQLVDNPKIWKVYYDLSTSTDLDVSSSTSTVITVAACDDNLDGSWVYMNSGTGAGQLRYVSAANATTLTVNTAFTTTPDSTTDFILIRPQGLSTGGQILNTTFDMFLSALDNTTSQQMLILKNFVQGPTGTQELDITANPNLEMDGLDTRGVRFFSHVIFLDTLVHATGL